MKKLFVILLMLCVATTGFAQRVKYGATAQILKGSAEFGSGLDIGTVVMWSGTSIPSNFAECNGASLATASYASLFAKIGYGYGGSGASFNLPDFRGVFPQGVGSNGTLGSNYSAARGLPQPDHFQGHYHDSTSNAPGSDPNQYYITGVSTGGNPYGYNPVGIGVAGPATQAAYGTVRFAATTKPASVGIYFIIKVS